MHRDTAVAKQSSLTAATTGKPQFPIYLLPSLKIPFRRRQTLLMGRYHPDEEGHSVSYLSSASVPSLSSPPGSSGSSHLSSPISTTNADFFTDSPPDYRNDTSPSRAAPFWTQPRLARVQPDTLRCGTCATDIAFGAQIVSRGFTGRHGRALLVSPPNNTGSPSCPASPPSPPTPEASSAAAPDDGRDLLNVRVGRPENRQLVTGAHVVADISCVMCGTKVGWKYVDAREPAQKYKVGKFILETARVVVRRNWEDVENSDSGIGGATGVGGGGGGDAAFPSCVGDDCGSGWPAVDISGRRISTGGGNARRKSLANAGSRGSGESTREMEELAEEEGAEEVVFDSDDEEECEDIFAGTWDAGVVARRRQTKVANLRKKQDVAL